MNVPAPPACVRDPLHVHRMNTRLISRDDILVKTIQLNQNNRVELMHWTRGSSRLLVVARVASEI